MNFEEVKAFITVYTKDLDNCVKEVLEGTDSDRVKVKKLMQGIYDATDKYAEILFYELNAKESRDAIYNMYYLNPQMEKQKPTAADLDANATQATQAMQEKLDFYSLAGKWMGMKLDNAKKLLSELETYSYTCGESKKQTLNE